MCDLVDRIRQSKLDDYEADQGLLKEHFGIEQVVLAGGASILGFICSRSKATPNRASYCRCW